MAKLSNETTNLEKDLNKVIPELSDAELGLEGNEGSKIEPSEPTSSKRVVKKQAPEVEKTKKAMLDAAAASAVKAAAQANSEMSLKEAEKTYIIEKKKYMLNRCKSDDEVEFVGQKIFANYFGPVYTFTYNLIPVTVKFDGSKQKFPRFIYNRIMEKINEVSDSNTNKEEIEYL